MQRRHAALGGRDKFTGDPGANVSPMQHILHKKIQLHCCIIVLSSDRNVKNKEPLGPRLATMKKDAWDTVQVQPRNCPLDTLALKLKAEDYRAGVRRSLDTSNPNCLWQKKSSTNLILLRKAGL
jgi:hypothetical protein